MADLIISQPMTFTVDVKNGLVERPQRESLMRGDRMANRIIAELVDGSEPFDITGVTVKGKFCRPPSGDEIDLAGEAKGNVAEVQLTDQCYTSGGHYEARVILVLGGVERTVLFISGDVLKSGSGNAASDEETGGSGGSTGSGLPAGGTAGQVLVKVSSAQGDAIWKNLTAADVGALGKNETAVNAAKLNGKSADQYALKTDLPTKAADVGALPSDGTAADSAKLGGKAPEYYLQPVNLLDNSDFRNPVNQRAQKSYKSEGSAIYTIDRWLIDGTGAEISVIDDGIKISNPTSSNRAFFTRFKIGHIVTGKTYTGVIALKNGTVYCGSGIATSSGAVNLTSNANNVYFQIQKATETDQAKLIVKTGKTVEVAYCAFYEGAYTAETLPPYVPKGYTAELAECQRYYYKIKAYWKWLASGICQKETLANIAMNLPASMRISPSINILTPSLIKIKCGNTIAQVPSAISCVVASEFKDIIQLDCTVSGATPGDVAMLYFDNGGAIEISADL